MYEPNDPGLQRVKSRISAASWERRVEQARADEAVIEEILAETRRCGVLNHAIAKVVAAARRSWAIRRVTAYRKRGFEGLIETRVPREPTVSRACREALQAARAANPRLKTSQALAILRHQHVMPLPSESTIKREFARVDERRRYAGRAQPVAVRQVVELPFAGGELLLAAEVETQGIAELTKRVIGIAEEAKASAQGREPAKDSAHRNRRGQFTVGYNRRRKRKSGEKIASYLRSAAEKAEGRVPTWPRFVHERSESLEAKLRMLVFGPLVATTKGWDALRATEAAGLQSLTGFAYMPSTLAKFVSALAISGGGPLLLEAVGQRWHEVAQAHFDEPGAMAALYIDNHAKEVWSSLFTMSGKVSRLNRVMPCITTTYAHTGAGTPVVLSVQSGAAPLAPRLITLVERAERVLGGDVERAVVIDSEGSTFDLLESFSKRKRVLITPLRPARAPDLELRYSRGSYFRPYRDNDELRVASCTLRHKATGRELELGALIIRRNHRSSDNVLLTNGISLGMEGRDLADLYFRRWPIQENAFKEGAAVGLDRHKGNCGRMVANVAIVTEMEKIETRIQSAREAQSRVAADTAALEATAEKLDKEDRRAKAALAIRRRRIDDLIKHDKTAGKTFAKTAVEHQHALVHAEKVAAQVNAANLAVERNHARAAKLQKRIADDTARQQRLTPQRSIRQLDVAQDSILTAAKLTALQLIAFALRLYLADRPMTPQTFITRVLSIQGRKEIDATAEYIYFYENIRDPEMSDALRNACLRLNQRNLQRDGRLLHYSVEPAPPTPAVRVI